MSFTNWINLGLSALVIFYPAWRIIEVVTFYLRQIIQRQPIVANVQRSFVFALSNYFEVTFWFAVWHSLFVRCGYLTIENSSPSWLSIFRESLAMMLVNSSNTFGPTPSRLVWTAICIQSVVGLFLTLVVVARTIASLPPLKDSACTTAPPEEQR